MKESRITGVVFSSTCCDFPSSLCCTLENGTVEQVCINVLTKSQMEENLSVLCRDEQISALRHFLLGLILFGGIRLSDWHVWSFLQRVTLGDNFF